MKEMDESKVENSGLASWISRWTEDFRIERASTCSPTSTKLGKPLALQQSRPGQAIKTTPITILNETFLNHLMNLKPSSFSQRPSLCTICYLHNQTGIASDCIIHPSIHQSSLPHKSSRSHMSCARRPKVLSASMAD